GSTAEVGDPSPARLGREFDGLAAAIGLDVNEGAAVVIQEDVELTSLDALVEPGAAEDEAPQPVHQRTIRGTDELGPALVHVLPERRRGIADLAVDNQVDQVLGLVVRDV